MEDTVSTKQTDKEAFFAIFLIGFLCLMLELTAVRMFSFFLGSISNFLAVPAALFGLALGSLFCHFFYRGEKERLIRIASLLLFPALLLTFFAFFFIANHFFDKIHMAIDKPGRETARMLIYSGIFLPAYFLFGVLLSAYFSERSHIVGRLYFFDLVGAGLGCLVTSLLFTYTDLPPVIVTMLMGSCLLIVNTRFPYRTVAILLCVTILCAVQAMAYMGLAFKEHPDPATISSILFRGSTATGVEESASRWNHLTRTALYRNRAESGNPVDADFVIVQDDGISNVSVFKYNPSMKAETILGFNCHHTLPSLLGMSPKKILVMFAGAGQDMILLDVLSGGNADITGVELNPAVGELALGPAAYMMNLKKFFEKPNIRYVVQEGRDFLNNDRGRYDVILAATNGAVNAGRTGHTRKYLDTYEAVRAYLDHLSEDGVLVFVNQPIESKIEALRRLFEERGLGDFSKSVFAFSAKGSRTLQSAVIRRRPFTKKEAEILNEQRVKTHPKWETIYSPFGPQKPYFKEIVTVPVQERGKAAVTDDRPFTLKVSFDGFELFPPKGKLSNAEYASNWIKIFTCILFAAVSLIVIFIVRFAGKKEGRLPLSWLLYFFVSGVSYMAVEIGLIAKTELFVGNPLYAVAVILACFLIFNGVGAYLQDRYRVMRGLKTLLVISALSIAWGIACAEVYNRTLLSIPMVLKVLCVAVAVFPSGCALGMYYPLGVAALVRSGRQACVPATYGMATLSSVFGSSLAVTLITNIGFATMIAAGAAGYLLVAFVYLAAVSGDLRRF